HSWIWFLAAALLALASTPGEAAERKLFRFGADKLTPSWDAIAEEHSLEVDFGLLSAESERLELELPGGDTYVVTATDFEHRAPGRYVWRGEILETPDSAPFDVGEVTLTVHDGFLVGRLVTPSGTYTVQPRAAGGHSIARVDPSRLPGCGGGEAPDELLGVPADEVLHDPVFDKARKVITVLGVYTGAARNGAGGRAQMEALINGSVDLLNTAFQRSRVDARARLVHIALIALPDRPSMFDALPELRLDPQVAALRDRWRADVVSGYYENDQRLCGLGYVMRSPGQSFAPFAYSITLRLCAPGITTAHEIGHNLGLEHNPENSSATPATASFPWSFGHYHSGKYRTLMSSPAQCTSSCPSRANFSNPNIAVQNLPTGIAGQRHNQRTLKVTAGIVEQFRGEELTPGFDWAQGEPRIGAPVTFLDASGGGPTSWAWNFGDGTTAAEASPSHTYTETGTYTVTLTVSNGAMTETLSRDLEVRDNVCVASGSTVCLNRNRFQVTVDWRDFDGVSGSGTLAPAGSDDSGLFWFFDEANWEMLVKVLDGCGFNDRFWVFAAATTNVEYTLRVVDTLTGYVSEYVNPLGIAAGAITDSSAFATCSASAGAAADDLEALAAPAQRVSVRNRHGIQGGTGACSGDSESLCLNSERFRVEVEWSDFEGNQGAGSAVASRTDDSGLFWFFDEANWEMLVKVLDGCGVNGHFWVFSAATTNVAYTLQVIDTETGEVREYTNALGNRAPATADTEAFTTCS
ncbi:MAG: PKD domain-containing protein, partial [Thermoanaerobaculia bacterium]